jgi:hypothetical protein
MTVVVDASGAFALSLEDLREVSAYAAQCAQESLEVFERARPGDSRPRDAIDAARAFARGGARGKLLRDTAWAALRAAREAAVAAGADPVSRAADAAARSATSAASAAYLHPLADAAQVKHILGAAAYAARAAEIVAGDDPGVGTARIAEARRRAPATVVDVLRRYPAAPPGGGRVGALMRDLDEQLRA